VLVYWSELIKYRCNPELAYVCDRFIWF